MPSACQGYSTSRPPGLTMPAFSKAILSRVSPRMAVWSREMEAITAASGASMALVASNRPPRPTSSTTMSHCRRANQWKARAVMNSNSVTVSPTASWASAMGDSSSTSCASSSGGIISPLIWNRSRKSST